MDPASHIPQGVDHVPVPDSQCADAQRLLHSPVLADPVSKVLDSDNLVIEMMDPALFPQWNHPIPNTSCLDAKRLWCTTTPDNPIAKGLDDGSTSYWSVSVPPLDDKNLLEEILLRLPSKPSSLPRASLVCTSWHNILSNPKFLSRFRKHHRKAPLLGFFTRINGFVPVLETKPDRIPVERFTVPKVLQYCDILGCRHGLAILIHDCGREAIIWDPLTGQHHLVAFPPGLHNAEGNTCWTWHTTVLCADVEDGHVHGDCFSSPFKLALVCGGDKQASACLYESASGVWGNIVSTTTTSVIVRIRSGVLIGNAVYWLLSSSDVLAFDIERLSLDVIEKPTDNHVTCEWCFQILRMEDGLLGLAVVSEFAIKLWERKSTSDCVARWVMQKTIPLEGMLPQGMRCGDNKAVLFVGYDEDTNVIVVLTTSLRYFMLELDSMKIRHITQMDGNHLDTFIPYTNFYTAGNISLSTLYKQRKSN